MAIPKKRDGRTRDARDIKASITPELRELEIEGYVETPPLVVENVARTPPKRLSGEGGGRPTKDTSELKREQAMALFALGRNNSEVEREIGVTRKTVRQWREEASRPAPKRNAIGHIVGTSNDLMTAEMIRMYQSEDMTYVQIAEELGVSYVTVRNRLKKVYSEYADKMRADLAGKAFADIQVLKEEALTIIVRDCTPEIEAAAAELENADPDDQASFRAIIERAYHKGRKNTETKFKAMEVYLKLLEREAKLFGLDAATNVNFNHTLKVEPQAIELLQRINNDRSNEQSEIIDAEVVEGDTLDLGNP